MLSPSEQSQQSSSQSEFMLGHLAPPQQVKTNTVKPINHLLKMKIDNQLNRKQNIGKKNKSKLSERSRSRQQLFCPKNRNSLYESTRQAIQKVKLQEADRFKENVIEISDDEQSKRDAELQLKGRTYLRDWQLSNIDQLNWRQRRKIDRIMQRGLKYYREGKPKDQLTYKIFNTIQEYFK